MKLSVLIITYNHERFVAQAIESVLAQRVNFDYDIVIGEDCSTDGTRAVIQEFQRRYPERIVAFFRERNVGGLRNLEATLPACRGQYLAILEGDDYWTCPNKLQRQVEFLDSHPKYAISCHRVRFLDETGSGQAGSHPPHPAGSYTIEDLLRGNFVMTGSAVVRRDLVALLPPSFSDLKAGDWARSVLTARHGTIELMDDIMAVYRLHAGGAWSGLSPDARLKETAGVLRALDKELGFRYAATIRQTIASPYLQMALTARSNGRRIETGKNLLRCVCNGGLSLGMSARTLAGLAAYTLLGSGYKLFSRAGNSADSV